MDRIDALEWEVRRARDRLHALEGASSGSLEHRKALDGAVHELEGRVLVLEDGLRALQSDKVTAEAIAASVASKIQADGGRKFTSLQSLGVRFAIAAAIASGMLQTYAVFH